MEKSKEFQMILRNRLIPLLVSKSYALDYDNAKDAKSDKSSLVFKLVFNGKNNIEISNDDYRDYTEYFNFYLNTKKLFTANIKDYPDLNICYKNCEISLLKNLA